MLCVGNRDHVFLHLCFVIGLRPGGINWCSKGSWQWSLLYKKKPVVRIQFPILSQSRVSSQKFWPSGSGRIPGLLESQLKCVPFLSPLWPTSHWDYYSELLYSVRCVTGASWEYRECFPHAAAPLPAWTDSSCFSTACAHDQFHPPPFRRLFIPKPQEMLNSTLNWWR